MITERDLNSAIAECKGKRNPDASTCIKLAAYYTIRRELFGDVSNAYSYAPAPIRSTVEFGGDSEFARAVDGKEQYPVLQVLDELMTTLKVIQPKLYNAVMDKLS